MESQSTMKIFPTIPDKPPDDTLPPGALLNHDKYRIERFLGRGGFGVTYMALDQSLGLRVAVKECLPRATAWRNDSAAAVQWGVPAPEQEAILENFVKEARKMAKIDQIPGVVRVREYFYDNDTAYIVMDYVDGETLADYLARTGSMSAEECFRLLSPVMDSLALAHKRGLIHRDISPNNIMIERGGERVWLLDLGAAKNLGTRAFAPNVSNGTQIVGTPGYTPLEQYDPNGKIGAWTDIYALSATFVRCMTGQKPPPSTSRAMKDGVPELLRPAPEKVGAALLKGLAQNPEERYQTMTEFRDALEKAIPKKKKVRSKKPKPKKPIVEKPKPAPKPISEKPPVPKAALIMAAFLVVLLIPLSIMLTRSKTATSNTTEMPSENDPQPVGNEEGKVEEPSYIVASGHYPSWSWELDLLGGLTISGTGSMGYASSYDETPWLNYKDSIFSVEILEGITDIRNFAFRECSNLSSVKIADSVTSIGYASFYDCPNLTEVNIPNTVTKIDNWSFFGCSNLTTLTIPGTVTEIGIAAFYGCSNLTDVTILEGVTIIGNLAFSETSLKNIVIPEGVTLIGTEAFQKCSNLSSVTIPNSVTFIDYGAFSDCIALQHVSIPNSVNKIYPGTFFGCTNLESVSIPDSVTEIGYHAFKNCSRLKKVSIPANVSFKDYDDNDIDLSDVFDETTTVTRR